MRIAKAANQQVWLSLPRSRRLELLALARELEALGADGASAENAERTRRDGFVYIITNRAWPGCVKIGRAFDPDSRLRGYQTSSPHRDFELEFCEYFEDCFEAEREIHRRLDADRLNGEWFSFPVEDSREAILDFSASLCFRTEDHSDG